ncbi:hypothetical protein BH11CYA1_BH11CYA1_37130 [soil metagenome]
MERLLSIAKALILILIVAFVLVYQVISKQ